MKAKELIEILKRLNPDADVIMFSTVEGLGYLDDLIGVCMNGECVQLNSDSTKHTDITHIDLDLDL